MYRIGGFDYKDVVFRVRPYANSIRVLTLYIIQLGIHCVVLASAVMRKLQYM